MDERLIPVGERIWRVDQSLRVFGVSFGTRMTVIKRDTGDLVLVSPVEMDTELINMLNELGPVAHVIAPNPFHYLFLMSCKTAFAQALYYAPESLARRFKKFKFDHIIGEEEGFRWEQDLEYVLVQPSRFFSEVVLFHSVSQTLILTDIVMNFQRAHNLWEHLFLRSFGVYKRLAPSRLMRLLIKDKQPLADLLKWVKKRQPKQMIVAHGDIVEDDVVASLKKAFVENL